MDHLLWQPTASFSTLKQRAFLLQQIRNFFAARQVLEVETPLLSQHSVTAPHIQSFKTAYQASDGKSFSYYLQTSPEYAMKRLLAAGSGPIYQISKTFRNGDFSEIHNPEFTMLEWYRPGFDLNQLMDEVDALLQLILQTPKADRISYQNLFIRYLGINPFKCSTEELIQLSQQKEINLVGETHDFDRDTWLQLLMGHCIEPIIAREKPLFVYNFPASQAALARLNPDNPQTAARFEVYMQGMELANGFYELCDPKEQRARFIQEQQERMHLTYPPISIDEHLIAALEYGLPDCSGVALGIDRLMMCVFKTHQIKEVISFDWPRS